MANGHGGARPGAGRKAKADKYAAEITAMDETIAGELPTLVDTMLKLARGGYKIIKEKYEPAGLIQIEKEVVTKDGTFSVKELAFPDLDPEDLVCVAREVTTPIPDRQAIKDLFERLLGKPSQALEIDANVSGLDITEQVRSAAAQELELWRKSMIEELSNTPSALPTPPMPATPTE